jgi:hypothetical protein
MRKFVVVAGAAVVVAGLVGLAGTAAADTGSTAAEAGQRAYITQGTTGYQHADNRSAPMFTNLKPGQEVTALCFTEGQQLNGNHYWFRISMTPEPNGNTAFVHRDAISVNGGDVRHC